MKKDSKKEWDHIEGHPIPDDSTSNSSKIPKEGYEKSVTESISSMKRRVIAKRDFVIHQNEIHIVIKAGDDLSHVPEKYLENLKTEAVI